MIDHTTEDNHPVGASESWPKIAPDARADAGPFELPHGKTGGAYVYFLGDSTGQRIKVGRSDRWKLDRLDEHEQGDVFGFGGNWKILALVRGGRTDERAIKTYFAKYRVAGLPRKKEVFHAAPLLSYVTWLRDNFFVSTTRDEFFSEIGQVEIDSNFWLPRDDRTSTRANAVDLLSSLDPWNILPSRRVTADDWYTKPEIIEKVTAALGGCIDRDPASHVQANMVVQARRFFTVGDETDRATRGGLRQDWGGRVFVNPPFEDWKHFVPKIVREADRCEAIIALGFTRTLSAKYFRPLLDRSDAMVLVTGRLTFWGMFSEAKSAPDGMFLLYMGPHVDRFLAVMTGLGACWVAARGAQ